MNEIDEDHIKQWSLLFSDLISAKFKSNISFKDFESEEVIYSEFLSETVEPHWVTLCEDTTDHQPIIVAMSYPCLVATTNRFFSTSAKIYKEEIKALSFTERFIGEEISNEIVPAFATHDMQLTFIRNEMNLGLVRPFHEDDSITIYKFNWAIENETMGEMKVCHSNVL
jgi:hypothetical protein